ncbi:hypothetical protein H6F67_08455 [Microcoleus sp. FACHB-1515]|uniref:hypothetical protein n=1 Tax=Cyanophyceae TaxID=3028117 RepID=UPI001684762B|nr:hypothetical protein [Microcoleus sp. FACHB-1515]MBD2089884.1 hypothetical protein [Microcoleus sp. FACHB-1515]
MKIGLCGGLGVVLWLASGSCAIALPGQTVQEAIAWIRANPTLQPAARETLRVQKSDTAARRFSFEASTQPPGRAGIGGAGIIRSEQIAFFDMIDGVTRDRLESALRSIYGVEIQQDFAISQLVYQYPTAIELSQAQNQNAPLLAALQGELREGDRFAYWLELAPGRNGISYTGRITVFDKNDLAALVEVLRDR